ESLRGAWLTIDAADIPLLDDPDEFHDHQLTGLTVVTVSGELVGTVTDVLHHGQALLAVTRTAGTSRRAEVLVPFVAPIAVEVDLAGGRLVIDPPPGLLDLGQGSSDGGGPGGSREGWHHHDLPRLLQPARGFPAGQGSRAWPDRVRRARPAELGARRAPQRGRHPVWRRAGDGDEPGSVGRGL